MKVISVFGTRPEAIKMAPLVQELAIHPQIESKIVVTAQHREMLDQVLELFRLKPDYDLNIMRHGQTISGITAAVISGLEDILTREKPDLVLVHGDTTTTFAASLAAFYQRIPCGHIEAGLRTDNKYSPYPEEVNRRLTSILADYHFAPTLGAQKNLLRENISPEYIAVTGNTVIDALLQVVEKPCSLANLGLDDVNWQKRVILLTCHRRESWGEPMKRVFSAVKEIKNRYPDLEIVFPVHKNPKVRELAYGILGNIKGIHLCEPLDYLPFCHVMNKSFLVLTDSGGMQEEAPALGKPVLVLREVTERPEAVTAGTACLLGTDKENIIKNLTLLLDNPAEYNKMAKAVNPFGNGTASQQIVEKICQWMNV
ncbi:MAG: UDP-N-acetylglucosamine 2-epimerase (non-hydrolyzing) [Clostridiales bacterium]